MATNKEYGVIGVIGDCYVTRLRYSPIVANDIILFLLKNGIHHNIILNKKSTIIEAVYPSLYHLRQAKNITQMHIIKKATEKIAFNNSKY